MPASPTGSSMHLAHLDANTMSFACRDQGLNHEAHCDPPCKLACGLGLACHSSLCEPSTKPQLVAEVQCGQDTRGKPTTPPGTCVKLCKGSVSSKPRLPLDLQP